MRAFQYPKITGSTTKEGDQFKAKVLSDNGIANGYLIEGITKNVYRFGTDSMTGAMANLTVSNGSIQSATITKSGDSYVDIPALYLTEDSTLKEGGLPAKMRVKMGVASVSIDIKGYNYCVGDVLTLMGGNKTKPALIQVDEVNKLGSILSASVIDGGTEYTSIVLSAYADNKSNKAGYDAKFNVYWKVESIEVIDGGKEYNDSVGCTVESYTIDCSLVNSDSVGKGEASIGITVDGVRKFIRLINQHSLETFDNESFIYYVNAYGEIIINRQFINGVAVNVSNVVLDAN